MRRRGASRPALSRRLGRGLGTRPRRRGRGRGCHRMWAGIGLGMVGLVGCRVQGSGRVKDRRSWVGVGRRLAVGVDSFVGREERRMVADWEEECWRSLVLVGSRTAGLERSWVEEDIRPVVGRMAVEGGNHPVAGRRNNRRLTL